MVGVERVNNLSVNLTGYFYISAVPRSASRRIIFYDAPVVLNDVMCTGNEESILSCTETGYGVFDDCMSVAVAQCEGKFALNSSSKMYMSNVYRLTSLTFMD